MEQHINILLGWWLLDTALSKGDFYTNDRNHLVSLYDNEELLQRTIIRLCVKKGSFIYDRNLGSRLYALTHKTKDIKEKALSYAKEALWSMNYVKVEDVEVDFKNNNLNLNFIISINNEKFEKAVIIW